MGRVCFPSHHHSTTSITRPRMRSASGGHCSTGKARGRLPPAGGLFSVHVHALSTCVQLLAIAAWPLWSWLKLLAERDERVCTRCARGTQIARSDSGLADRTLVVASGIRDDLGEQSGGEVHLPPRHGSDLLVSRSYWWTYWRLTGDLPSVTAGFGRSMAAGSILTVGGNSKGASCSGSAGTVLVCAWKVAT